jgi:hypothetical protein
VGGDWRSVILGSTSAASHGMRCWIVHILMLNNVDSTATENRLTVVTVVVLGSGIFQLLCCGWHPDPLGVENPWVCQQWGVRYV